jgi:hypothetical protein
LGSGEFKIGQRLGLTHLGQGQIAATLEPQCQPAPGADALTHIYLDGLDVPEGDIQFNAATKAPTGDARLTCRAIESVAS